MPVEPKVCRECGAPIPDDYADDICDSCYNDLAEQEADDEEEANDR